MEQAIANVEHNPAFLSLTNSTMIDQTKANGTYTYEEYTNNPERDIRCGPNSPIRTLARYLNPFHEYTTTTLVFSVSFIGTRPDGTQVGTDLGLLVEVNPATGQIYNISEHIPCS